jgi:hypothetical protein
MVAGVLPHKPAISDFLIRPGQTRDNAKKGTVPNFRLPDVWKMIL